ncbi:cupin domain-containing protein [uncultured Roseobacter sp.]|uniref:cupin domain-containing protein n=1 Tax=uncultured Roseobacter sp. TaxID=114847 RepID=UPI00260C6B47|nr:cupin domain-containing protein [uncultured Roseobacter sp.]
MRLAYWLTGLTMLSATMGSAETAPPIAIVDSATPTEELPVKPGVYVGQKITFDDTHAGETIVRVGVWEADVSQTRLIDYPFTEYVLMISGRLVITNADGSTQEFTAGDTFVMPKGWTGIWDVRERMKKQMVQIGDPTAVPKGEPVK